MGDMTRTQMEAHVKLRIGNRTDMDSYITDAVKMSYAAIVATFLMPENQEVALMLTTANTATYTLPVDFVYPVSFRNVTEEEPLIQLGPKRLDAIKDLTRAESPTHYLWWRNQLTLYPTPNAGYSIQLRYVKRLDGLDTGTTVSALPREWDEIIIQGAFYRMLSWLDQGDQSLKEEMRFKNMAQGVVDRLGLGKIDTEDAAAPQIGATTAWRQR